MPSTRRNKRLLRWARQLAPPRSLAAIGLALSPACSSSTGNGDLLPSPSYSWRGRIVDSITGAPVDHTAFVVREHSAHQAAGFVPHLEVQRFPNRLFLAAYTLNGFRCAQAADTSLTLHLEIVDSLGRYQPAVHQSTWLLNCDRSPEPAPDPFPREDSLRVRLQPNP